MYYPQALPSRSHAVARMLLTMLLALLSHVSLALPAPQRVNLDYTYSPGDAFTVRGTLARNVEMRRSIDGHVNSGKDSHTVNRYVYHQVVNRVLPDGRQAAATRHYVTDGTASISAGKPTPQVASKLQGRTFVAKATRDDPEVTPTNGLGSVELQELAAMLSDEYAGVVIAGTRTVGESWPLPEDAARGFYLQSKTTGTCTLQSITNVSGMSCARVVVAGEVDARDVQGRHANLHLRGSLLWSLDLKRVVSFTMEAQNSLTFTTHQGAAEVTETSDILFRQRHDYTWTAFAGKPVRARGGKRP